MFGSWENARARAYRRLHDIPDDWGTAVTVQAMVFGNRGERSATGVIFTRNPSTGENALYGEYLVNAQGEDVVSGMRTPQALSEAARNVSGDQRPSLEALMPKVFAELKKNCARLEAHFHDLQDIEFTVEEGKLWILQTRSGKRTTQAALKIAVDMADAGVISKKEAVMSINADQLDQLLHPTLDPTAEKMVIASGLPASPGAASGELVFDADEAVHMKAHGHTVVLATDRDFAGRCARHARRRWHSHHAGRHDEPCGRRCARHRRGLAFRARPPCTSISSARRLQAGGVTLHKGDLVTIDGSTGQIIKGRVKTREPKLSEDFNTLIGLGRQVPPA